MVKVLEVLVMTLLRMLERLNVRLLEQLKKNLELGEGPTFGINGGLKN